MLQENQVFFKMSRSGQSKMLPGVLLPHERHPNRESPPSQLQNSHCCSWHGNPATPAGTNTCTDLQTTHPAERGAELTHPSPRAAWQPREIPQPRFDQVQINMQEGITPAAQ